MVGGQDQKAAMENHCMVAENWRKPRLVVVLQIFFKYDNDLCLKELGDLRRALQRPFKHAMHDKRHLAFVCNTDETPAQLVDRLAPVLEVDAISNYWATIPYNNMAGKFKGLDSLATHVKMAYAAIKNGDGTKYVGEVKPRFRKGRVRNASIQMPLNSLRDRKDA